MADAEVEVEVEVEVQGTPPLTPLEDTPQPERKVIASTVQGTVKWFNVRNGYGFINRNDTQEDVFVHQTAIIKNNPRKFLRSVGDGEIVEFDVIEAPKGTEAANVTGPGGVPVKGSCYAPNKRRFRRRIFPRSPRPGKPVDGQAPTSEGEGAGENDGTVPAQRRRRPRRPRQEGESAEPKSEVADDKQQRVPRRRFRPLRNRPFQPRPPSEQPEEASKQPETRAEASKQPEEASKQPETRAEASKQPEEASKQPEEASKQPEEASKQPETRAEAQPEEANKQPDSPAPQQAGDSAEGQAQRPRRQFSRRRQRVSQSKNGTEKPASDSDTQQPQNSKPADPKSTSKSPKSSPKSSPKTSISQERSPPNTVCAPTE